MSSMKEDRNRFLTAAAEAEEWREDNKYKLLAKLEIPALHILKRELTGNKYNGHNFDSGDIPKINKLIEQYEWNNF